MPRIEKFRLAWLSVTYQCNSRCVWCYAGSNEYERMRGRVLSPDRQEGILDLIGNLGIGRVTLIGGEPTVYPGIESLVGKITAKGIMPVMVTNGRRFRKREFVRRLAREGLRHAAFSIEGPREIHDRTSQIPGSFDEAIEGLDNALEEGIEVATNTVISSINCGHLEETVDALKDFKLKHIGFNISGPCIAGTNEYMISPRTAIAAFERVHEYAKLKGIQTKLSTPVPLCDFKPEHTREFVEEGTAWGGPCQIFNGRNFVIDYNGDIVPCTHLTGFPLFSIFEDGRVIGRDEFLERYNSEFAGIFRERVGKYASVKCNDCEEKCASGCPLLWTEFDPEKEINGHNLSLPVLQ